MKAIKQENILSMHIFTHYGPFRLLLPAVTELLSLRFLRKINRTALKKKKNKKSDTYS